MRFILAQKAAQAELERLRSLIGGRLSFQKLHGGHALTVQTTNLKPLLRYFQNFPLKTIKRVSLIKFLAIYRVVITSTANKKLLSVEEMRFIKRRANEINKLEKVVEYKVRPAE